MSAGGGGDGHSSWISTSNGGWTMTAGKDYKFIFMYCASNSNTLSISGFENTGRGSDTGEYWVWGYKTNVKKGDVFNITSSAVVRIDNAYVVLE